MVGQAPLDREFNVITGPDRAGKSTILKYFGKSLSWRDLRGLPRYKELLRNIEFVALELSPEERAGIILAIVLKMIDLATPGSVLDSYWFRFWAKEKVFGGRADLLLAVGKRLPFPRKVALLFPGWDIIEKRFEKRPPHPYEGNLEFQKKVWHELLNLLDSLGLEYKIFDTSGEVKDVVAEIKDFFSVE